MIAQRPMNTVPYMAQIAAIGVASLLAVTTRAEVVYVDLPDFRFGPRGPAIDVNGDQLADYRVGMGMDCPAGCSAFIGGLGGNEVVSVEDWALGLPGGALIGPDLPFSETATLAAYDASGCFAGDWCGQTNDLYVGIRFHSSAGAHYGWIRTRNDLGIRVLDCAFETEADTPVLTGDGWPCPDLDGDRQIGLSDLAILLSHFGSVDGNSFATGDLNDDGSVDVSDLAGLLAEFGIPCP